MNGQLALDISLCIYGTAFLQDKKFSINDIENENTTFKFVKDIAFEKKYNNEWKSIALNTSEWLKFLKENNFTRLFIRHINYNTELPQHVAVAFAGSSGWVIGIEGLNGVEWWQSNWKSGRSRKGRIWSVTYRSLGLTKEKLPTLLSIDKAKEELKKALSNACIFCEKANIQSWLKWFQDAEKQLESKEPQFKFHPDLLPEGWYMLNIRQLLTAAEHSWVFGGMGSWNDVWLENPDLQNEYEEITNKLFSVMMNSFIIAVDEATKADA